MIKIKKSKYNFFFQLDNGDYIAYNALKNGLAVLGKDLVKSIECLEPDGSMGVEKGLEDELEKGGYICPADFDEFSTLVLRNNRAQYSTNSLGLTIAPTIDCNLACNYCYENPDPHVMDDDVVDGLEKFVKDYIDSGIKTLGITWFGGEPLLSLKVIEKISKKLISLCETYKVDYSAFIITNGVLLTGNVAEKLKSLNVRAAQVTIDGNESTHDLRRPFKNGKGSFALIWNNLKESCGVLPISLRVNVDTTNVDSVLQFFNDRRKEEWFEKNFGRNISVHYGYVQQYSSSCGCSKDEILKPGDFWQRELELQKYIAGKGQDFNVYPSNQSGCVATTVNGFVVGPKGELYKCWNHVGLPESVVGNIFDAIEFNYSHIEYLTENFERDSECRECKYLPICMGGCPDIRVKTKKGQMDSKGCSGWKYYLEDALREYYYAKMGQKSSCGNSNCRC